MKIDVSQGHRDKVVSEVGLFFTYSVIELSFMSFVCGYFEVYVLRDAKTLSCAVESMKLQFRLDTIALSGLETGSRLRGFVKQVSPPSC